MSKNQGTVIVNAYATSCTRAEVECTSALRFCEKYKVSKVSLSLVLNEGGVRRATAAYFESLFPVTGESAPVVAPAESTPAIDKLATLLEVRSMIVELRAMLAPLIAERAAELASGQVAA
jgi:hypothetical protein